MIRRKPKTLDATIDMILERHDARRPVTADEALREHVAAHRPGRPGKIALDPELRRFVDERITLMTFKQLVAEIAAQFPPERRISLSSLHRYWQGLQRVQR